MHFSTTFLSAGLASVALAAYTVQDDYSGNNFFGMFRFDTENDPTNGYVNYVDGSTAQQDNLTSVNNGVVTIRSDSTNVASGRGRNSVRLTSYKQYTHGLVVLDLEHMPGSACGIWPAFWMTGPSWPNNGEIDIIEGVNYQSTNAMTMHSNSGCTMVNKICQGFQGCGVQEGGPASFGDGFNSANGGVYAMEWTSTAINIWFFGRNNIPAGATGANPDPSSWGSALASFQGGSGCNIDDHFNNNNIVFDTTFCGDWAGAVWSQDSTCSSKAATCQDYVKNNPSAFESAYWAINSLKVYTSSGSTPAAALAVTPTTTPAAPVALPTTTEAATSVTAPTPSTAPNTVGLGSSTPGGTITENPIAKEKRAAAPANGAGGMSDGKLTWGDGKRDFDTPFNSVVEQPAVTKRSMADGVEEIQPLLSNRLVGLASTIDIGGGPDVKPEHLLVIVPFDKPTAILERIKKNHPNIKITFRKLLITDTPWKGTATLPQELIHFFSAGTNNIAKSPIYTSTSIPLTTSSGIHGPQIAEWVILTALAHSHHYSLLHSWQVDHEWGTGSNHNALRSLRDKAGQRLGVLGYGSIGRQVARVGKAMGMDVIAYTASPRTTPESKHDKGFIVPGTGDPDGSIPSAWYSGLDRKSLHNFLSQDIDHLLISVPLTKETTHFIPAEEFAILGKTRNAFISNISRGQIINQSDLITYLHKYADNDPLDGKDGGGGLRGAALDVTDPEPLPKDHPLWDAPNCIITPHISGLGEAYMDRAFQVLEVNLDRRERGKKMINVVDRKRGY